MMTELGVALVLALGGFGILASLRWRPGYAIVWLAVPVGAVMYLLSALVLLTFTGTLSPPTALFITGATGLVGLVFVAVRGWLMSRKLISWALVTVVTVTVTVVVARTVHMARLTPDSMRYLLFASDMQQPHALAEIYRPDLLLRQMGLPSLQALASLTDGRYLASMGPLFGVSLLGFFTWFGWRATAEMATGRRLGVVVAAVAFVMSSNRLVYDFFYIHTHIEVAAFTLIAICGAWLAATTGQWHWGVPAGLALAATLMFRPDSPMVAGIVLVAFGATLVGWRERLAMTLPTIGVSALWYGVILWQYANGGNLISLTAPVFGSLVILAGAVVVVLAGGSRSLRPVTGRLDLVMLVALILVLVVLASTNADIFLTSLQAGFQNVVLSRGAWLLTWTVGVPLFVVALWVHQVPAARLFVVSIVGFGITWLMLPLLRGGPWRVGTGDSGSRILAHILAVLVTFLVLALIRSWGWLRSKNWGRPSAEAVSLRR